MASFPYTTSVTVHRNRVFDVNQGFNEDGLFDFVQTELHLCRRNGNSAAVQVGRSVTEISMNGVVSGEETPVLELIQRLAELRVPAEFHARIIAPLLHYIDSVVIPRHLYQGTTVVMTIEARGMVVGEQSQVSVVDDYIVVEEVMQLREEMSLSRQELTHTRWPLQAAGAAAAADDLDLVEALSQSMEEEDRNVPESFISGKVEQGEVGFAPSCSICIDDEDKHEFARMPCTHLFHRECLATWLRLSATCPLCRLPMPTSGSFFFSLDS